MHIYPSDYQIPKYTYYVRFFGIFKQRTFTAPSIAYLVVNNEKNAHFFKMPSSECKVAFVKGYNLS